MNLLPYINVIKATTDLKTGGSTIFSKVVDMQGFEGCVFVVVGTTKLLGTSGLAAHNKKVKLRVAMSTASTGTFVKAQQYVLSSSSGLAAGTDHRLLMMDVYRPLKRYIRAQVYGASSASTQLAAIMAIQYGARRPGSSVLNMSTHIAGSTIYPGATSS